MVKGISHKILRIIKTIDGIAFYISKLSMIFCGILLVFITAMIFAGVINRFFSLWTWLFVEEWSSLALVPLSYLAFGYTLRYNKHLKMDLLVRMMSTKLQNAFAVFSGVFSMVCLVFLIQFSKTWLDYQIENSVVSSGPMHTPLWIISLTIFVGMILFALDMFLFTINRILALKYNEAPLQFFDQIETELNIVNLEGELTWTQK